MSYFNVDQTKCNRDGICAETCPVGLIGFSAGEYPQMAEGAEMYCNSCGHCVAVCPKGAVSLTKMKMEECTATGGDFLPTVEQVEHLLRGRRSIRTYKKERVARETLAKLIDVARYGPTGHNQQPVEWIVVEDPAEVHRIAGVVADWMGLVIKEKPEFAQAMGFAGLVAAWEQGKDMICRDAPHLIIAHAPEANFISESSCVIAITYLELAAYAMGLGACWGGFVRAAAAYYPPLNEALGVPQGNAVFGAVMVGYPKYRYSRIPQRKQPKITWK